MSLMFRYEHIPRSDGTLRNAPLIPIYVKDNDNQLYRWLAMIDSGADSTVISKDTALFLGLKEKDAGAKSTAGIGGEVEVKESTLHFQIKNEREKHCLTVPVLVLQDKKSDIPILLGRNGFFDHFHITFKQNEKKVVLKKLPFLKY